MIYRFLLAISVLIAFGIPSSIVADERNISVKQVFLIQNSGWMEPFYKDPASSFKPFISALVDQSNLSGVDIIVATFNQDGQVQGQKSPNVLFRGPYSRKTVEEAVGEIEIPFKASGAYADADFNGALLKTVSDVLKGDEGVIWMITNNKDSPNNSQSVVENTNKFYQTLRGSPYIERIYAYPIRDDLSGPNFRERGFIVYAIAYGPNAARALDVQLREGSPVRKLFRHPPIRIKPLDREPVELRLTTTPPPGSPRASVEGGVLRVRGVNGQDRVTIDLQGVLRNTYYPQNIDFANLSARWAGADAPARSMSISVDPRSISGVPALANSSPVKVALTIPSVPRRGPLFGIFDNKTALSGVLEIQLDNMTFSLDPEFLDRMQSISASGALIAAQGERLVSNQLPVVFLDYKKVSSATTRLPVEVMIERSPWPLIGFLAFVGVTFVGLALALVWISRARTHSIQLGGGSVQVSLRPFERRTVSDVYGNRAHVQGSLIGGPRIWTIDEDKA